MVAQLSCGNLIGETRITDLDFADDAVTLAEFLDVLRTLSKEAEPLGIDVSSKTLFVYTFQ